jgi:hypothetical protein
MVGKEGFREMAKFKISIDNSGILGQGNIFPKKILILGVLMWSCFVMKSSGA